MSERRHLVRILLRCYPRRFRQRYGRELEKMAIDLLREGEGQGPFRRLGLWGRLLADAVVQGSAQRLEAMRFGVRRGGAGEPIVLDGRQAVRALLRRPGFVLLSVATLGVGIAAVTTAFSLFYAVLLRPLPFPEADRLVGLWHAAPGLRPDEINQSPASYFLYREGNRVFEDVGLWDRGQVTVTGVDRPERVTRLLVTEGLLPTLRFPVTLGRGFVPQDDRPGAAPTTVLTHPYWRDGFGADPAVIGRSISIDGEPHEIVGILDKGFLFTDVSLLTPARFDRAGVMNGDFSYQIIARLEPGVTLERARGDLERLLPRLATDFPGQLTSATLRDGEFRPVVRSLRDDFVGDVEAPLWMLMAVVCGVLVVACANVGNLFLVRAEGRQQEMATRTAMGASNGSIFRTLLAESVLLALASGVVGMVLAVWGVEALVAHGPEILRRVPAAEVNGPVLGVILGASVLSGLFFGVLSTMHLRAGGLAYGLKQGGRSGGGGPASQRLRDGLMVTQVALAVVLSVGSGLMARSFRAMQRVDPGFRAPAELVTVRVGFPERRVSDPATVARRHRALLDELETIPGVTAAGASTSVTMDGRDSHNPIHFEAFPVTAGELPAVHRVKFVAGAYAETMGIPVVAGRPLTWDDLEERRRAVVVSEDLALRYWAAAGDALGQRLGFHPGEWWEIVGVTGAVHDDGLHRERVPIVYFPMVGTRAGGAVHVARTLTYVLRAGSAPTLLPRIREVIRSVDPDLPLTDLGTHEEVMRESLSRTAFSMLLLSVSAGIALLLGTVGVYSVISYAVSRRTREIGVRMALGADRRSVGRLVLRRGLVTIGVGLGIGVLAAATLGRLMESALFGVRGLDPLTFGSVALGLSLVGLLATWVPARRAAGVDPVAALRAE